MDPKKAGRRKKALGAAEPPEDEKQPHQYSFEVEQPHQHTESAMRRTNDFRNTQTALNKTFTNYRF